MSPRSRKGLILFTRPLIAGFRIGGLFKRLEFRADNRAFQHEYESLLQRADKEDAESEHTIRDEYESLVRRADKEYTESGRTVRDDYEELTKKGLAKGRDIYLFLRPLKLGDTIRFPDLEMKHLMTFEEVLKEAIDSDGRVVACVGNGGESVGVRRKSISTRSGEPVSFRFSSLPL